MFCIGIDMAFARGKERALNSSMVLYQLIGINIPTNLQMQSIYRLSDFSSFIKLDCRQRIAWLVCAFTFYFECYLRSERWILNEVSRVFCCSDITSTNSSQLHNFVCICIPTIYIYTRLLISLALYTTVIFKIQLHLCT